MNNILLYKGCFGSAQLSVDDKVFYGKILGIDDTFLYEGNSVEELIEAFHETVDDYLETCKQLGKEPAKLYKGQFNVRVSPSLHKESAVFAGQLNITLNEFVNMALEFALENTSKIQDKVFLKTATERR